MSKENDREAIEHVDVHHKYSDRQICPECQSANVRIECMSFDYGAEMACRYFDCPDCEATGSFNYRITYDYDYEDTTWESFLTEEEMAEKVWVHPDQIGLLDGFGGENEK